jgi:anti-sigma factor RsiW
VEHLTQQQLEDYALQRLGAADLLTVSDHLGECELCRRQAEAGMNGDGAFFALHEEAFRDDTGLSAHLTTEQTADYVDKNLSGESLQIATDHLAGCEPCALAVADLRAFRNEIAPSLDREYSPTPVPITVRPRATRDSWRSTFASFFRVSPVPAFGGAALAVLLLALVAWLVWRRTDERQPQVVAVPAPVSQPSPSTESPSVPPQPEPAPVVAQLNDGNGVLTLDEKGNLSGADNLPVAYKALVTRALTTQRIGRSSQLEGLTRPPSSLMSSDNQKEQFAVIYPAGDVMMTNYPTFRWSPLEGATGYEVEVYDAQFNLVASSPRVTNTSWATSLPRGHVYSWQVKAIKDGQEVTSPRPPAPQARFRVLDHNRANELAKAKRTYGSSHLTLAVLYADAGLLKEAEQELRLLRRANPNSDLATKLLRQVQALRN